MDLMGELALGDNFAVLRHGEPARYSKLVEESQRYGNMCSFLPFGKASPKILSYVPLPSVQRLWRARLEYLEYTRVALEHRYTRGESIVDGKKPREDILQRFIEAVDPETGDKLSFAELRAETSSLM
jgi:benzoate 4-monooxygenase